MPSNRLRLGSGSIVLIAALGVLAIAVAVVVRSRNALPAPGSESYEAVTRAFYRGLASLEVGLLDDARREFTTVTTMVPEEPAGWANLGLANLRLGELDAAASPIERAMALAPDNADLALLAGRMEIARGGLDAGLAHLRRAVELNPQAPQPRFALAEEVERAAAPGADAEALALLDDVSKLVPQNVAVLVERARVAAKAGDTQRLNESIASLRPVSATWPEPAVEQYRDLQQAVAANNFADAQRSTAFLRNVLARVPAFGEDLGAIRTSTELIAEPVEQFIALMPPPAAPVDPDVTLTFGEEPIGPAGTQVMGPLITVPGEADVPEILGVDIPLLMPPGKDTAPGLASVKVADWNNDFRPDIVMAGMGGVRVFIRQADGRFADQTPADAMAAACVCQGVWPADVEMDGDLDLIVAPQAGAPFVLRNNGDGGWSGVTMFPGVSDVSDVAWADVDQDSDPDAVFLSRSPDGSTRLSVFVNRQAGDFVALPAPPVTSPAALTVADIDSDGAFDIIALEQSGSIRAVTLLNGQWSGRELAQAAGEFRNARLIAADFDNNGALDLIATGTDQSRIWLGDASRQLRPVDRPLPADVFPAGDLNADGRVDLTTVGTVERRPVRLLNRGTANYHWKVVRPRAQANAGDQRINSFGVGGYIEVRAGLMFQKQLLTGGPVHVGLGTHTSIDVARIVWPNGVPQAEFGVGVDDGMVAEQRLKGSCPWVFTWDGSRMVFVTDFLWRSPLGLRINAQDTAGVTQTEDWVRLRGDQLVPRGGMYDVRITAELWETHYFDHVSLLAVDHPDDTEVFVDERFSAAAPPELKVYALQRLRPVARARDHHGADVTRVVSVVDGEYLSTFARGRYQGIAQDHFVEVDVDDVGMGTMLVATGWIYPTDSSINVAIAQGGITPRGLSLEAQRPDGTWRVVNADLGFPAGKNKTILVDLGAAAGARRIRLRTNLEIYWDALQLGSPATSQVRTTRIAAGNADLRYRGFSKTVSPRGDAPETPEYDRIDSTSPRWRDLSGYHTRFGDVRELVDRVDDRYVIMNAGDELRLQFAEVPPPRSGWRRDFVLIGDGWEKDGDYNTSFSQTVLPLPSHDRPAYGAETRSLELEDDPVYQRYREDWQRYHTRYVTPRRFLNGLKTD